MQKKRSGLKAVILAGGSGERFWPLSTSARPKQFLKVFGRESLIRMSVTRLKGLVAPDDVFVVTSAALARLSREELPELPPANVVGEPMRRDTAAAVALGVGVAAGRDEGDPVLAFFPADQLVTDVKAFRQALKKARAIAEKTDEIVTLGIRPSYPATTFGYIDPKKGGFVEKPDAKKARAYLKRGFLWNAGMFIARASVFRAQFERHASGLAPLLERPKAGFTPRVLARIYEPLPKISFDYAIMEKQARVSVVPADCGWDDVGGYGAFDKHFARDAAGCVTLGEVNAVETEDCVCVARGAPIATLGVKGLVVVTTPEGVLVCDKSKVAELKKLFKK